MQVESVKVNFTHLIWNSAHCLFDFRRKESGEFYCHIDVPIPEQLVIFSEGLWDDRKDFDVILRYKDDEVQLGHISRSNR